MKKKETEVAGGKDMKVVAEEINDLQLEFNKSMNMSLALAIELGKKLIEAKDDIPHGKFSEWVHNHLSFTERTSQNYMKLYERRDELKKAGIEQITDAYAHIKPVIEKEPIDVSEHKRSAPLDEASSQDSIYNYWPLIERLILSLNTGYTKLSGMRNAQTPKALGHFIGNIKEIALRLEQWQPEVLESCSVCKGSGSRLIETDGRNESIDCEYCLHGKAGPWKESKY